jgi:hypothetical protein
LLVAPGWLVLDLLGLRRDRDAAEQTALAVGASLALAVVAMLWTTVAGVRWLRWPTVIVFCVGVVACIWRWPRGHRSKPSAAGGWPSDRGIGAAWPAWAVFATFVFALAVRLAMVRDLVAPAWVDSVHHALLASRIADLGGLSADLGPALATVSNTYHPGYHVIAALFTWLTDLGLPQAMLLLGQVLNALMVPAVYLLAVSLTADRGVGAAAALVTGLVSTYPAIYTNWGRYTQLAGLLVLCAAAALTLRALDSAGSSRPSRRAHVLLAALVIAGLALTHYRVLGFFVCLVAAYLLGQRYGRHTRWPVVRRDLATLSVIGIVALLVAGPWLARVARDLWFPELTRWPDPDPAKYNRFAWEYLTLGYGQQLLALAAVGAAWGVFRRARVVLTIIMWVALLLLMAAYGPAGLRLGSVVNYSSVEMVLFLPVSILVGYLAKELWTAWSESLPAAWLPFWRASAVVAAGAVALFGARSMLPTVGMETALVRRADLTAMAWIRDEVPAEATFLVNPAPWYPGACVGTDGGYWIAPVTGRRTLPPPALYAWGSFDRIEAVDRLCQGVLRYASDAERLAVLARANGISHVYLGPRGGPISASALVSSPRWTAVYARDGVRVFALVPEG